MSNDTPDSNRTVGIDAYAALGKLWEFMTLPPDLDATIIQLVDFALDKGFRLAPSNLVLSRPNIVRAVDPVPPFVTSASKHAQYFANHVPRRMLGPILKDVSDEPPRLVDRMSVFLRQFHKLYETRRGDVIPVGMKLTATYQGQELSATVQEDGIAFDGNVYPDPSAAAVAAKMSLGATREAAKTNGWKFWQMGKGTPQGLLPIDWLRPKKTLLGGALDDD